jgi:hypothetical protein
MNGEDDVSHYLSEYFGSRRCGVGPGAVSGILAHIRNGDSLPVSGVACSGSAAAIPAPRSLPRRRLATCCPRCWGRECWFSSVELGDHRAELDRTHQPAAAPNPCPTNRNWLG